MRLTVLKLKQLIRETLYQASAPKRFNLEPIEVEADNTEKAGEVASQRFYKEKNVRVDPMTVDLKEVPPAASMKGKLKFMDGIIREDPDSIALDVWHYAVDVFKHQPLSGGSSLSINIKPTKTLVAIDPLTNRSNPGQPMWYAIAFLSITDGPIVVGTSPKPNGLFIMLKRDDGARRPVGVVREENVTKMITVLQKFINAEMQYAPGHSMPSFQRMLEFLKKQNP